MKRRFVFVDEIEALVARGQTDLKVPEGTRFSPLAADLIREKGVRVFFSNGPQGDSLGQPVSREKRPITAGSEERPEETPAERPGGFIAVASEGKNSTAEVGAAAARSRFFLLFDRRGELTEVLENPHRATDSGAGPLVAGFLAGRGVSTLVAQRFGGNLKASLSRNGIAYTECFGPAADAVGSLLMRA